MNRGERAAAADRLRARLELVAPLESFGRAWVSREVLVQRIVLLSSDLGVVGREPRVNDIDSREYRYLTEIGFRFWVDHEALVAAELELAKVLNQPVADVDVASFLRERDHLLDTDARRRRFAEDEEYERAVFVMALAAVELARRGSRLSARLSELYRDVLQDDYSIGEQP